MELVLASESDKIERDRLSGAVWDPALNVEQFLEREHQLRSQKWASERMATWLLRESGQVLASCETFRMDSWLDSSRGSTYGIASVFTEESLRHRGYASAMLALLHEQIGATDAAAHATILFSDVGEDLYRRLGYEARPASDWVFPATATASRAERVHEREIDEALRLITPPDLPFLVWPSAGQIDWHLERERAYARILARPRPASCGARTESGLALWAADYKNERLGILLLEAQDPRQASRLIAAARKAAHQAGLREVRLWDHPGLEALELHGEKLSRDNELPMIRPQSAFAPEAWEWTARALWI